MDAKSSASEPIHSGRRFTDEEMLDPTFDFLPKVITAPMPVFDPIEDTPALTQEQTERLFPPKPVNPEIVHAEKECRSGDVSRAKLCIERLLQADTPKKDLEGCLHRAVESGREELVQLLVPPGSHIGVPLLEVAFKNRSLGVLSLLLKRGWDLNEPEAWCMPPHFSRALCLNPDPALVSWFLDNGADPNVACQVDTTPLSSAVAEAPLSVVKQLFDHVPKDTIFRGQLLHHAAQRTDKDAVDVVQLVLDRCQPDINAIMYRDCPLAHECFKNGGLGTALHEAAKMGQPSVAEILLRNGSDTSIRDSLDATPLERAEIDGNYGVAEVIRQAEAKRAKLHGSKI